MAIHVRYRQAERRATAVIVLALVVAMLTALLPSHPSVAAAPNLAVSAAVLQEMPGAEHGPASAANHCPCGYAAALVSHVLVDTPRLERGADYAGFDANVLASAFLSLPDRPPRS